MLLLEQSSLFVFSNYFAVFSASKYFKEHLSVTISRMLPSSKSQFLIEIVLSEIVSLCGKSVREKMSD